jgi:hypothetical protein
MTNKSATNLRDVGIIATIVLVSVILLKFSSKDDSIKVASAGASAAVAAANQSVVNPSSQIAGDFKEESANLTDTFQALSESSSESIANVLEPFWTVSRAIDDDTVTDVPLEIEATSDTSGVSEPIDYSGSRITGAVSSGQGNTGVTTTTGGGSGGTGDSSSGDSSDASATGGLLTGGAGTSGDSTSSGSGSTDAVSSGQDSTGVTTTTGGGSGSGGDVSVFPVGIFSVPIPEMMLVQQKSFNVIACPQWAQGPTGTPPYLKAARDNGFFFIAGFVDETIRNENGEYIEAYVKAVKDDDHLLAWYIFEEPKSTLITIEEGEFAYNKIREYDPNRPILFVDFYQPNIQNYRNCYDIFGYDYYPIGNGSVTHWRTQVKAVMALARPKPVWLVIQAAGFDDPNKAWVLPTPQEVRCMTYVGIIQGAKGILFWSYYYLRLSYPEHWQYIQDLGAELNLLSPVLLSPAVDERVKVNNTHIDITLREYIRGSSVPNKELYVIAANTVDQGSQVKRHFPGVKQADVQISIEGVDNGRAELVGDAGTGSGKAGRSVPILGGTLVDSFDPYAVHIYKIITTSS